MKSFIKISALAGIIFTLSACADTSQGKLKQALYDEAAIYHASALTLPDVMEGKVKGINLTDAQKNVIKKASQSVYTQLSSLTDDVANNKDLSTTAVDQVSTNISVFKACWNGLQSGTAIPQSCLDLTGDK